MVCVILAGCLHDVVSPDQFRVISLVTATPVDSTHCDVKWKSETNDPHRVYLFVARIFPGTGTTGQAYDSTFATDSATIEAILTGSGNASVSWSFAWSGSSGILGDTTVASCVVQ